MPGEQVPGSVRESGSGKSTGPSVTRRPGKAGHCPIPWQIIWLCFDTKIIHGFQIMPTEMRPPVPAVLGRPSNLALIATMAVLADMMNTARPPA